MGMIPCSLADLQAREPRILSLLPREQSDFTPQWDAAEKEIVADLANRQHPIRLSYFQSLAQVTTLKTFKTLEIIYGAACMSGIDKDRNGAMEAKYAGKYASSLAALHVETTDGGHVPLRRKLVRAG